MNVNSSFINSMLLICVSFLLYNNAYTSNADSKTETQSVQLQEKKPQDFYLPRIASIIEIAESPNLMTEFFQLQSNPNVYILDFSSLEEQGHTMNRLALLVEASNAPKNRVVNDEEMGKIVLETRQNVATLYLGHDVRLESLARFFNLVKENKIQLNSYEQKLKNTLLKNQLINIKNEKYQAIENAALVTVSKVQEDNPDNIQDETITQQMRQYIILHEASHGEYFTNKKYQQYCQKFWKANLTEEQRQSFRNYLDNKYYDPKQEDLMVNEFQAYLVYTGIQFGDLFEANKFEKMSSEAVLKLRNDFILESTSTLPITYTD